MESSMEKHQVDQAPTVYGNFNKDVSYRYV